MTALSGWENFYVIVGSSAGALIGLQFVVITLIANRPTAPGQAQAGRRVRDGCPRSPERVEGRDAHRLSLRRRSLCTGSVGLESALVCTARAEERGVKAAVLTASLAVVTTRPGSPASSTNSGTRWPASTTPAGTAETSGPGSGSS